MKERIFLLIFFILSFGIQIFAQYPIGHQTLTFTDPSRSNRSVTTETYYPATSAGDNTPFASGQFPLIVFGHGFVMGYDAYAYFKDAMVPLGYIVVFATTESSMSPSHSNFGLDLAFLLDTIKNESAINSSSLFYNKVAATSAIMGHSMGGGSSFLACENNTVPTCMVTFAAANTTPSSITAAQNVSIPALVLSGSVDCVADPATNQVPMYDSLASACKVFISITNGCHCYFADYNFYCVAGEQTCDITPPLSRANQEDATLDFVKLYLDYYLKGNAASWNTFNDSLNVSPRITHQIYCPTTGIDEINNNSVSVWPNPSHDNISVNCSSGKISSVKIINVLGTELWKKNFTSANSIFYQNIDVSGLTNGIYFIEIDADGSKFFKNFIKN